MRGRLSDRGESIGRVGNTPAYAGKTSHHNNPRIWHGKHPRVCGEDQTKRDFLQFLPKHPRVCGEDPILRAGLTTGLETPPRMRGRLIKYGIIAFVVRNTPAYAGKTRMPHNPRYAPRKHPRVCGEDFSTTIKNAHKSETPPRMRGRPPGRWQ